MLHSKTDNDPYLMPTILHIYEENGRIIELQEIDGLLPDRAQLQKLRDFCNYSLENYHLTEQRNQFIIECRNSPAPEEDPGFIYIAQDTTVPYLKIGYTTNLAVRERTLQAQKPTISFLRTFEGTRAQEKTIHKILAKHRVRGEWFNIALDQAVEAVEHVTKTLFLV